MSDDSWGESTIDWENAPSAGAELARQAIPAVGSWLEADITSQVNTEISGDKMITLFLEAPYDTDALVDFYSKENGTASNDPQLYIDYGRTKSAPYTLAVNEVEENELTVYPNPASSQVTIQLNDIVYNARIFDINGNLVKALKNVNGVKTIQANEIGAAGVYFIKAIVEDEVLIKKLILK